MKVIPGTPAELSDVRAALASASGFPRRATGIHPAVAHLVPDTYHPGAFGWTDNLTDVPVDFKDGTGVLEVPAEADAFAGWLVTVGKKQVAIPAAVDKSALSSASADKYAATQQSRTAYESALVAVAVDVQTKGG